MILITHLRLLLGLSNELNELSYLIVTSVVNYLINQIECNCTIRSKVSVRVTQTVNTKKLYGSFLKCIPTQQSIFFFSKIMQFSFIQRQKSNGASLVCIHQEDNEHSDQYSHYILYGLLTRASGLSSIDRVNSPHLFTNIYNSRHWLEKILSKHFHS